MEQDAKGFIADWVRDNIGEASPNGPLGDMSTPDELAELCRAEAREAGIPDRQLDAAAADLAGGGVGGGAGGLARHLADAADRELDEAAARWPAPSDDGSHA